MAVGMGALFESNYLYGLSERESSLILSSTLLNKNSQLYHKKDPYRFFNIDYFKHRNGDPRGEYGSIPYVTAHSVENDASLLWVNSADTWTDLINSKEGNKMMTNFVSESG
jgi:mannosyl-oligosaccharide alpha-1,3-glucosidase